MAATKVALITASSAGLGAQIARAFAPDFRVVSIIRSRLRGVVSDMFDKIILTSTR
jgi:NAD(P)-dependent dehydrogenase (short-subunit alcohol dehydrogenase family)